MLAWYNFSIIVRYLRQRFNDDIVPGILVWIATKRTVQYRKKKEYEWKKWSPVSWIITWIIQTSLSLWVEIHWKSDLRLPKLPNNFAIGEEILVDYVKLWYRRGVRETCLQVLDSLNFKTRPHAEISLWKRVLIAWRLKFVWHSASFLDRGSGHLGAQKTVINEWHIFA